MGLGFTLDESLVAKLDAAWGDPSAWQANGLQWTHLPRIKGLVQRRVTGDPGQDLIDWFARHVSRQERLPLPRVLVLGCGTGGVELSLLDRGIAASVVAFDLSARAVEESRARLPDGAPVTYAQADMNHLPVGEAPFDAGSFDAVVGVSCVHHCEALEALYDALLRLLRPGGWLYLDEYIGPDRFQYSPAEMRHIAALAELLPDCLLTTQSGDVRRGFRAPTVDEVIAVDPSEAVSASRILPALDGRFHMEAQRPYGGALLQLLLADVAQNFRGEAGEAWLQALIEAEDELYRLGQLSHHFSCVIARAPGVPPETMARNAAANRAGS